MHKRSLLLRSRWSMQRRPSRLLSNDNLKQSKRFGAAVEQSAERLDTDMDRAWTAFIEKVDALPQGDRAKSPAKRKARRRAKGSKKLWHS